MKKHVKKIPLCLVLVILIASAIGTASVQSAENQYTLPEDIAEVFQDEQWSAYHVVFPGRYNVKSGYENGTCFPVILKKGDTNIFCILEKQDSAWRVAFVNEHALYPGDNLPKDIDYFYSPPYAEIGADARHDLIIGYDQELPKNITNVNYYYTIHDGEWLLRMIQIFHPETPGSYVGGLDYCETTITPSDGKLIYHTILNEKDVFPNQERTYESSVLLEGIDIDTIPLSY